MSGSLNPGGRMFGCGCDTAFASALSDGWLNDCKAACGEMDEGPGVSPGSRSEEGELAR